MVVFSGPAASLQRRAPGANFSKSALLQVRGISITKY